MTKKNFLDSIDVPAPCPKSWDGMTGDDKVRFCGSCEKDIYNISEMTRGEVRKLLFQSSERLCIRLEKDADGKVQTLKKRLHKITRQAPIAAGVLSASLTFSALTYAQGKPIVGKVKPDISAVNRDNEAVTLISGIISDQSGAVIPNATITLRDAKSNSTRNTKSNDEGFYEFKNVEKSVYEIEVEARGFKKSTYQNVIVGGDKNLQLKITLESSEPTDSDFIAADDKAIQTIKSAQVSNKIENRKIESLPTTQTFIGAVLRIEPTLNKKSVKNQIKTSQISFTIYDPRDEVIPNTKVELTNRKTEEEFTVITNQNGIAQFSLIPRGRYDVLVSSTIGFQSFEQTVSIKQSIEPNIKITLQVGFVTGVFVIDWSDIPLFQAITQKDNDVVKQKINAGFDINTKDSYGETALHVAVQHGNLKIIQFLLEKGAKVNVKDKSKRAPLAMIFDSFEDDEAVMKKIIRLLVSKGADINVRNDDESKQTFLMTAAEDNNIESVKFFLELGANPNLKDEDGETAMQKTKSDEIKRFLISYGARGN